MVEEAEQQFVLEDIIPPSPFTQRGYTSSIDVCESKNLLAYCVTNVIVLRNLNDLKKCDVFTKHIKQTTAVRFTKSGTIICSGDIEGNIIIWETFGTKPIRKQYNGLLNGAVRDLSWTSDNQRLILVGEGKQVFGKAILAETGSSVGEVTGSSKVLLCADVRPERPFKLATGGEEFLVCFAEGPPFKYLHNTKSHTNYVNSLRYKPNGEVYVSVSTDKKLILYDGKTGDELQVLDKAHEGGISRVAWFSDNLHFVTSSFDKTVKVWAHEGTTVHLLKTLVPNQNATIDDQQVSIATHLSRVISFSLNGTLNVWANFETEEQPSLKLIGHQSPISQLLFTKDHSTLVASDRNGRILLWRDGIATNPSGESHTLQLRNSSLSNDSKYLYSLDKGANIKKLSLDDNKFIAQLKIEKGVPCGLVASKSDANQIFLLYEDGKIQILNGELKVERELQAKSDSDFTFIDISHNGMFLALGDARGVVQLVQAADGSSVGRLDHYGNKITSIRFSHNDELLVVGESAYKIRLWSVKDLKVNFVLTQEITLTSDWGYHSASISDLIFTNSDQYVISCSQDNKVCVFNTSTYAREAEYKELHKNGIFGIEIDQNGRIISGGGDALIKITKNKEKQFN